MYSCIDSKADQSDKVKIEDVQNEIKSVVTWNKRRLVTFNASETKLISINNLREPSLSSISMADADPRRVTHCALSG